MKDESPLQKLVAVEMVLGNNVLLVCILKHSQNPESVAQCILNRLQTVSELANNFSF